MPVIIMQCTSSYPVALEKVGLNNLEIFRNKYKCPVGLSDHSGTVFPALAAMAEGANIIEVHVTFDKRIYGPDAIASITVDELGFLVEAKKAFWTMKKNPVDKDILSRELSKTRELFGRSIAPSRPLEVGTVLKADMMTPKKPGTGIPAERINELVGRRLIKPVVPDRLLSWDDLE
jgi:N-acetylneuraminate synthase